MAAKKSKARSSMKTDPAVPKLMPKTAPQASEAAPEKGGKPNKAMAGSQSGAGKAAAISEAVAKAARPAAARVASVKASAAKPAAKPNAAGAPNAKAMVGIGEGSKAPSFSLSDDNGLVVSSESLAGKPYVLYFYPKDDTPGCTQEACDFRDNLAAFNSQKVRVLGVSPDDPKRHANFKRKYGLTFTLLSDPEKSLIQAYGVWVKKLNYGREYLGVQRSTFLIDGAGTVVKAWLGVRVPGHVDAVLKAARA